MNRPVRTRMRGGVGAGRANLPATRLHGHADYDTGSNGTETLLHLRHKHTDERPRHVLIEQGPHVAASASCSVISR